MPCLVPLRALFAGGGGEMTVASVEGVGGIVEGVEGIIKGVCERSGYCDRLQNLSFFLTISHNTENIVICGQKSVFYSNQS
jgi:hypothetical protein